jgi:phosphopantetheinyl transferase (holo-ACP synthase)
MRESLQLWLAAPQAAQHFDPAQLTGEERARMARLRRDTRRQEFAVSRALRAYVRRSGRPPVSESLSHSGGHAALAQAHSDLHVGVDLELHRTRDVLAIARTAFSASEAHALEIAAGRERERLFYAMWTVKEAFAKALQLPLMEALLSCEIVVDGTAWRVRTATSAAGCVAVYQPRTDLTLAVACIGAAPLIETWSWPPQQPASWPLIAAISLATAGAPAAADHGTAAATRAAAPA